MLCYYKPVVISVLPDLTTYHNEGHCYDKQLAGNKAEPLQLWHSLSIKSFHNQSELDGKGLHAPSM